MFVKKLHSRTINSHWRLSRIDNEFVIVSTHKPECSTNADVLKVGRIRPSGRICWHVPDYAVPVDSRKITEFGGFQFLIEYNDTEEKHQYILPKYGDRFIVHSKVYVLRNKTYGAQSFVLPRWPNWYRSIEVYQTKRGAIRTKPVNGNKLLTRVQSVETSRLLTCSGLDCAHTVNGAVYRVTGDNTHFVCMRDRSKDGYQLWYGVNRGKRLVFELFTVIRFGLPEYPTIWDFDVSPDNKMLVVSYGNYEKAISVIDVSDRDSPKLVATYETRSRSVTFSKDGLTLGVLRTAETEGGYELVVIDM